MDLGVERPGDCFQRRECTLSTPVSCLHADYQ